MQTKPAHRHGGKRDGSGPPTLEGARRVNVVLTDEAIDAARKIGDGNLSLGLRLAVKTASEIR